MFSCNAIGTPKGVPVFAVFQHVHLVFQIPSGSCNEHISSSFFAISKARLQTLQTQNVRTTKRSILYSMINDKGCIQLTGSILDNLVRLWWICHLSEVNHLRHIQWQTQRAFRNSGLLEAAVQSHQSQKPSIAVANYSVNQPGILHRKWKTMYCRSRTMTEHSRPIRGKIYSL